MSTGMIGADPRVLREMAATFDATAEKLMGVRSSVQAWVDRADIWRGLDNRQFADTWDTTDARAVTATAAALRRHADILRANAEEQDTTSADGGRLTGSGLFSGGEANAGARSSSGGGFVLDLSVPGTVVDWVEYSLKTIGYGSAANAFLNHRQFLNAAGDGNMPAMAFHFMREADFALFSDYIKHAGDAAGAVGTALDVVGSLQEISSAETLQESTMGLLHLATAGVGALGPVGSAGALVIQGFEHVMPTTTEKQIEVTAYGAEKMFPGIPYEDLSPTEQAQLASRYDGVTGFGNFVADTAGSFAEKSANTTSKIVSDGVSAVSSWFGGER